MLYGLPWFSWVGLRTVPPASRVSGILERVVDQLAGFGAQLVLPLKPPCMSAAWLTQDGWYTLLPFPPVICPSLRALAWPLSMGSLHTPQ